MLNIGITIPGRVSGLGGFNGNFASLFPTAYQVVQSDRGLTYGGTMLATAGNTSTATMTLSGTLASRPVPIWIVLDVSGIIADIYYDGLGVTPAMSGVSVLGGIPIALTGAASGLTITPSAGTLVANNSWKATCSALADQSGNGFHYTQATAASQPIISFGVGGKAGLLFDGVDDQMSSPTIVPGSSPPLYGFIVARLVTWGNTWLCGDALIAAQNGIRMGATSPPAMHMRGSNGLNVNGTTALPVGTFGAMEVLWTNSTSDFLQVGSGAPVTGTNSGYTGSSGRMIGSALSAGFTPCEIMAVIYTGALPSPADRAVARAGVVAFYGGSVSV